MKVIAKALLDAVAFLELSEDDVIDPDAAVRAMEMICADLVDSSPEEKAALALAASRAASESVSSGAPPATVEFYERFMDSFNLSEA